MPEDTTNNVSVTDGTTAIPTTPVEAVAAEEIAASVAPVIETPAEAAPVAASSAEEPAVPAAAEPTA